MCGSSMVLRIDPRRIVRSYTIINAFGKQWGLMRLLFSTNRFMGCLA